MLALYIILSILGLLLTYIIIISLVYKRSFFASIVEIYLLLTSKRKRHALFKKSFDRYLKKQQNEDPYYKLKTKTKCNVKEIYYNNVQILIFNENSNNKNIIIYFHGGAYISKPLKYHIKYIDKLAINTNSTVIFPIYPKAPHYHYDTSFKLINDLYFDILNKTNKSVVLMGDSSGGGLTLAFVEYLALNGLKQPSNTILLSPWLDISMSNEKLKKYERLDPMLSIYPLKIIGKMWANELDINDFKVSPLNGKVTNLKNITLITGDKEIVYPDIIDFSNKLKDNNVKHNLYIGKGMNHVFPLYPIKEAKIVNEYIYSLLKF